MTTRNHNLDALLKLVAAGRLDELTPEQVAALETHLNANPAAGDRLADVVPKADPEFDSVIRLPSQNQWNSVWKRLDSATEPSRSSVRSGPRYLQIWQPIVAAAACFVAIVVWHQTAPARPAIQLSDEVVVHELEVFGDDSAFVAYTDDGGTAIVWVIEGSSNNEGT